MLRLYVHGGLMYFFLYLCYDVEFTKCIKNQYLYYEYSSLLHINVSFVIDIKNL